MRNMTVVVSMTSASTLLHLVVETYGNEPDMALHDTFETLHNLNNPLHDDTVIHNFED